jgi:hypothetical protein
MIVGTISPTGMAGLRGLHRNPESNRIPKIIQGL